MKRNIIDTSGSLLFIPWNQGVKLIRPDNQLNNVHTCYFTLEEVFKLPLYTYLLDKNSVIQNINESAIDICGYPSLQKTIGKTRNLMATKETVDRIVKEDQIVLKNNQMQIFEEHVVLLNQLSYPVMAFKFPWYDIDNQIIGIFGISIFLHQANACTIVTDAMKLILKLGLLTTPGITPETTENSFELSGRKINNVYLSKREIECLYFLARGKTAKMIAKILTLSPRTVEYYIDNIKVKLNVRSKSELIDKFIENFDDK